MTEIELASYRAHDLPACLAAAGLVRVLTLHTGEQVRLSWGKACPTLYLPTGLTTDAVADRLRAVAGERGRSPDWDLLDACDDATAWVASCEGAYASGERGRMDFVAAAACYQGGEGGRSPLLCTARNVTPGRWGRKSAAAAAKSDWLAHFGRVVRVGRVLAGVASVRGKTGRPGRRLARP